MDEQYYDIERRTAVKESVRELRRKFLRYKDAEVVYSMTHKKLLELAGKAGAIYRIDGYVLLDRDIFDDYLELRNSWRKGIIWQVTHGSIRTSWMMWTWSFYSMISSRLSRV